MSNCQVVMVKKARLCCFFKFESAGVDFHCLPENVSLAACKFSICALEAFCFHEIAENEDDKCFQGCNQLSILKHKSLFWKLHLYLLDKNKNRLDYG